MLRQFVCAGCEQPNTTVKKGRGKRVYCNDCQVRSMNRRSTLTAAVKRAISEGKLLNPSSLKCVDCGKPAFCYDHRDWSKPLDVEPVCRSDNNRRGAAKNLWLKARA
jgi:hypothetical protein